MLCVSLGREHPQAVTDSACAVLDPDGSGEVSFTAFRDEMKRQQRLFPSAGTSGRRSKAAGDPSSPKPAQQSQHQQQAFWTPLDRYNAYLARVSTIAPFGRHRRTRGIGNNLEPSHRFGDRTAFPNTACL